jgi:hypothetical protein
MMIRNALGDCERYRGLTLIPYKMRGSGRGREACHVMVMRKNKPVQCSRDAVRGEFHHKEGELGFERLGFCRQHYKKMFGKRK